MVTDNDSTLVQRLRAGEEAAFVDLVSRYQAPLLRLAETTVGSRAVAEEVTQDTWLAVIRGVDRFEGRSSFQTWLFRILLNRARSAARGSSGPGGPTRRSTSASTRAGAWASPRCRGPTRSTTGWSPPSWRPGSRRCSRSSPTLSARSCCSATSTGSHPRTSAALLGITDGNQRVLLHRGRARLRALLADEVTR